jgi:hypothetical protein
VTSRYMHLGGGIPREWYHCQEPLVQASNERVTVIALRRQAPGLPSLATVRCGDVGSTCVAGLKSLQCVAMWHLLIGTVDAVLKSLCRGGGSFGALNGVQSAEIEADGTSEDEAAWKSEGLQKQKAGEIFYELTMSMVGNVS